MRFLTELFHPERVRKQYDRVLTAAKAHARAKSNAEFERTMADYFTVRVLGIDPHTNWNGFAEVKQKQHDHQNECLSYEKQAADAAAKLQAEEARYLKMTQKPDTKVQPPITLGT